MLRIFGNGEKMRNVQNIPIILIRQSSENYGIPHSHVIWASASQAYWTLFMHIMARDGNDKSVNIYHKQKAHGNSVYHSPNEANPEHMAN